MGGNSGPGFREHPDYRVDIRRIDARVEVALADHVVSVTTGALEVLETQHRPVLYVPKDDLCEDYVRASDTETYCPFKGFATYWSLQVGDCLANDALWIYAAPFDEVSELSEYVGVYANRVDSIRVDGQALESREPGLIG